MKNFEIKQNAIDTYNKTIREIGANSSESVHWGNQQTQYYRFAMISKYIPNDSNTQIN
jgi:hypothetical protein